MRLEKDFGLPVASGLHLGQLGVLPLVHRDGPDKGQVDTEAAVLAGTLKTDPDAVRDGHPLRVQGVALETGLNLCENREV